MGDIPTNGQLALLIAAIAVQLAGGIAAMLRLRQQPGDGAGRRTESLRIIAKGCLHLGTFLCICVLAWHSRVRGSWQPLQDNFSAFLWLAILLGLIVSYTQRVHPLRGLDFFVMPVVVMLLVLAAVFGKTRPHAYHETTWSIVHRVTAYGGFVALAVAGALGCMFLYANHRLRSKKLLPGQGFSSLERVERLTFVSVTLGFALLTVGLVTGFFKLLEAGAANNIGPPWYRNAKVVLTCVAWVVYALVLHAPINPAFRGRRTALLSVVGFVLMIGAFVAVQFTK